MALKLRTGGSKGAGIIKKGKRLGFFSSRKVDFRVNKRVILGGTRTVNCSRPTQTHPSVRVKKNIKNMKQSQINFKEIRLVLLLFLSLSPKHASQFQALPSSFSNPENNRENRKTTSIPFPSPPNPFSSILKKSRKIRKRLGL